MAARDTNHGFNDLPENQRVDRNFCRVRDLAADRREVYFFVADGKWIECETWCPDAWDLAGKDVLIKNTDFADQLDAALAAHMDDFVVVIDAHA